MTIISLTTHILHSYEYPHGGWVLVRIRTEDGIEGIGECFVPDQTGRGVLAAQAIMDHSLKQTVLGECVLDTTKIWEKMYNICGCLYDRRGMAIHAVSGIDMAVMDAAAKTLQIPLCRLLGGCFQDRIRVYISSIWVNPLDPSEALEATVDYVQQGYTAIKYYGWDGFGDHKRRDVALLQALRTAAGDQVDLMLDLGRPSGLAAAINTARMIETSGVDIYWWEEPLSSSDDLDNLAHLTEKTDLTIAAGESELTAFRFYELLQKRAVNLLQPDLSWVGGITEGKRIADMARLYNVPLVPHNWGTIINFAASIHLTASMPKGFLCEYPITPRTWDNPTPQPPSPMMTELASNPIVIEAGYAIVPDAPGLGIVLNEDAVAYYTEPR